MAVVYKENELHTKQTFFHPYGYIMKTCEIISGRT